MALHRGCVGCIRWRHVRQLADKRIRLRASVSALRASPGQVAPAARHGVVIHRREPGYTLAEPDSSVVPHPKRWVRDIQNHLGSFATKAGEKSGFGETNDQGGGREALPASFPFALQPVFPCVPSTTSLTYGSSSEHFAISIHRHPDHHTPAQGEERCIRYS